MAEQTQPQMMQDVGQLVELVIERVGNDIRLATPLAAGKANHVVNAFYQRAKNDPELKLTILTALTLERPKGNSLLEKRFLALFVDRVFSDYPDLDYELDRMANRLPDNVRVMEFYFPPGKYLHHPKIQQEYISSNYTHVVRDLMDRGANVSAQLLVPDETPGSNMVSASCNPDVSLDLVASMHERQQRDGTPYAAIGQINPKLPYMYGDAEVPAATFDYILDNADCYFTPFGTPKLSIPDREYLIGLWVSALIHDDGELQVGIGALGDAFVYALLLRQNQNERYRTLLQELGAKQNFGDLIRRVGGDTGTFEKGIFGGSEMVVDGFYHLYKAGVLKRIVFDDLPLQRLLNEGSIDQRVTPRTLELLLERKAVHSYLTHEDCDYLQHYGVLREGLTYREGSIHTPSGESIPADLGDADCRARIMAECLGEQLKRGAVVHGGFFLGPNSFYEALSKLPPKERRLFNMRSVRRVNQLYGHEEIDRLQRKNARFVNTCMLVTLSGAAVSDGLEDGRVISGVGGQFNFVVMAHELPDGRSILNLRATREEGARVLSNIVWNYGHTTIPRHLRDIVVTEYGIAELRGKTDSEIIEELLKIADSRFQLELMKQAKAAGKLREDYEIPAQFRDNYPERVLKVIAAHKDEGLFPKFPFGTDFTEAEQALGGALKRLKHKKRSKRLLVPALLRALFTLSIPAYLRPYLEMMGLWQPKNAEEWLFRNLLANELRTVVPEPD
jgi:acyl-CoA hydrolase